MSHDYDPSWDYPAIELDEIENISEVEKTSIVSVIERVRKDLAPALGDAEFCDFEAFFVDVEGLDHGRVAVYANGTASRPVMGFDLVLMKRHCEEHGLDLTHQFELSLAHELGHAYQESCGLDHDHEVGGFDEDDAEGFGRIWADRGVIDLRLLDPDAAPPSSPSGIKP